MEAHFHWVGNCKEVMEELMMDDSGLQMTERLAMRADEGIKSRPVTHLGFNEERVCSHHSGVVGVIERVGKEGELSGNEGQAVAEEEDVRGAEFMMLEITEAKWLRSLAKEVRLAKSRLISQVIQGPQVCKTF